MNRLETRILELEQVQAEQTTELKKSAVNVVESISPSSLLKNALKDIGSSAGLRSVALDTVIGIGTGFLGRKLFVGTSKNIFRKIAGSAVQFFVTNLVRRKMPDIRENLHHNKQENNLPEKHLVS